MVEPLLLVRRPAGNPRCEKRLSILYAGKDAGQHASLDSPFENNSGRLSEGALPHLRHGGWLVEEKINSWSSLEVNYDLFCVYLMEVGQITDGLCPYGLNF